MAANPDEPRPRPFTEWVASEPVALMFGIVAIPALAIALGIGRIAFGDGNVIRDFAKRGGDAGFFIEQRAVHDEVGVTADG